MILLTGSTGQVGTALLSVLEGEVVTPGRGVLDLLEPDTLGERLGSLRPTGIINCAAYTAVDAAEDEPKAALAINATSVGVLAGFAADRGIPFVTFSTDYVFDGTAMDPYLESSPTSPINAYGHSKALGERLALSAHPGALVVRTSWMMSTTHANFVTEIVERAAAGPVQVVTDEIGAPTFAPDLADATVAALDAGATGILHITNRGHTSRYDLARLACSEAGIDPGRIQPIAAAQHVTRARRPRYSVLGSERFETLGLVPSRHWREAIPLVVTAT